MTLFKIKHGLNLPLKGIPEQGEIRDIRHVSKIALLGNDYIGLRPKFTVSIGEKVKKGQVLFFDKKTPSVKFTSPGAGIVKEINRGEKRKFVSLIIEPDLKQDEISFPVHKPNQISNLKDSDIRNILSESGLWTSIRQRPFGKVADPEITPHSIFITAMDTNPLAPDVESMIAGQEEFFTAGLKILSYLTNGSLFLCKAEKSSVPEPDVPRMEVHYFSGPHPAGNPGTHIHYLDPVTKDKKVWHIHAQDAADIGKLFLTGSLPTDKVISIAGLEIINPGLYRIRKGAKISNLIKNNLTDNKSRVISGSVFNGHTAEGNMDYVGHFHNEITAISDEVKRPFLGWLMPGFSAFSVKNVVISKFMPKKKYKFTTAMHGGIRAIFPVESYDKVNVFDTEPVYLLRALAVGDIDDAVKLGCLHFTEEDIALFSFVCPAKIDHGDNLRKVLTEIEKEGL